MKTKKRKSISVSQIFSSVVCSLSHDCLS